MAKRNISGGVIAQRGFIFQSIIAIIECLDGDDWDSIKVEPETENDKVDIRLYKDGMVLSSIQVKSSINPFERSDVRNWLQGIREDAKGEGKILLCLVGDSFADACSEYVANTPEVRTVSLENLGAIYSDTLIRYIRKAGLGKKVKVDDLELIDASIFSKIHRNSITDGAVSREQFEDAFQRALPKGEIPKCLTPIPLVNQTVGLVGRDEIVRKVREMLENESCSFLVSGLGGIGKTAVMQWVCNDTKNEGKYVAWIDCGKSLKDDLLLLGEPLGIKEKDRTLLFNMIKCTIQSQLEGKLYLFLDNLTKVPDIDLLKEIRVWNVHIMITSRVGEDVFPYFPSIKLDVLLPDFALTMFYKYYGGDRERKYVDEVQNIVTSVNRHTLLVELLAKAAKKSGGTLRDFCGKLQEKGIFDVFKRKLRTIHDGDENLTIEDCVIKLYEISGLSPAQQHIMKLFSIFTPEKEIYYKVAEWANLNEDELDELIDLAWLERGGLENGYRIHQIIRDSLKKQFEKSGENPKLEDYGALLDIVTRTERYLPVELGYELVRERLVLAECIVAYLELRIKPFLTLHDKTTTDISSLKRISNLLNNIGGVYGDHSAYGTALEYFKKALTISVNALGKDHPDSAISYNNIGFVYCVQGIYGEALSYHHKALTIFEHALGKDHPYCAASCNNIGRVYCEKGEYSTALEYFLKAYTIFEHVQGEYHTDIATTYNNIGGVYRAQHDYAKALEYYLKALAIFESAQVENHPNIAATCNNIGLIYRDMGDYRKALEYLQKALSINMDALGEDHLFTATNYNNIGGVYLAQGDFDKALEYYQKDFEISERVLGEDHPKIATTYNNIGYVYRVQGDCRKALEYYQKALEINERILGKDHPSTAMIYNNIGGVYRDQGDYRNSLKYYHKAHAICKRVLGKNHPHTKSTWRSAMKTEELIRSETNKKQVVDI